VSWRALAGKRWSGYLSWRRKRRFVHRREMLDVLTAAVHDERPVHVLVTGDLVHIGLPAEIDTAAAWLDSLGPPERVMLVPGNHDVYARDSWPAASAAWARYLGVAGAATPVEAYPVCRKLSVDGAPLHLIGVSSAEPTPLFSAAGSLGDAQRARLEQALEAEAFRCLLIHHPPLPAMTSRRKGLRDAAALAALLERRGAELALHGHVHRNVEHTGPGGVRIFGTASASAQTAAGAKDGASYRVLDVNRDAAGWRVAMRLMGVTADGAVMRLDEQAWTVPAMRSASVASAGR
jgi:3',5'-cyclic AMP phosphodiesterase CpdA